MNKGGEGQTLSHPREPYPVLTWNLKCLSLFKICVPMSLLGTSYVWGTGYSQACEHTQRYRVARKGQYRRASNPA